MLSDLLDAMTDLAFLPPFVSRMGRLGLLDLPILGFQELCLAFKKQFHWSMVALGNSIMYIVLRYIVSTYYSMVFQIMVIEFSHPPVFGV